VPRRATGGDVNDPNWTCCFISAAAGATGECRLLSRIIAGATGSPCGEHPLLSQIDKLIPDNQVICQSGKPYAFIPVAHAFLAGFANFGKPLADAKIHAAVPLCVHHSLEGEHVHALRSRERGCFLVVQILWAEKIQSTTDAGSLIRGIGENPLRRREPLE